MAEFVTLTGVEEMKRQLTALPAEIKRGPILNGAILAGAKIVQNAVKGQAPVKTGALRDNIIIYRDRHPERSNATVRYSVMVRKIKISRKVRRLLRKIKKANAAVHISDMAFYWRFIEFGTSKMRANPFFRRGIAMAEPSLVNVVGAKLQSGIDSAAKKVGAK